MLKRSDRDRAVEILLNTTVTQGTHAMHGGTDTYCSLGIIAKEYGIVGSSGAVVAELMRIGFPYLTIINWNDHQKLSFAEIAAKFMLLEVEDDDPVTFVPDEWLESVNI